MFTSLSCVSANMQKRESFEEACEEVYVSNCGIALKSFEKLISFSTL